MGRFRYATPAQREARQTAEAKAARQEQEAARPRCRSCAIPCDLDQWRAACRTGQRWLKCPKCGRWLPPLFNLQKDGGPRG